MNTNEAIESIAILKQAISKIIRGQGETIDLILSALLAGGHVLLEDKPGVGKTTLAKCLGKLIECPGEDGLKPFNRIQFTPDLLPADIIGMNIYNPKETSFHFIPGPIFAHIVLADEINRTSPKVQAAFLECMAEKQITVDGENHQLDDFFFVIGTQNPIEFMGTYPLPLVQLDRFMLKIPMPYIKREDEIDVIRESGVIENLLDSMEAVIKREQILSIQQLVKTQIYIDDELLKSAIDIIRATREDPSFDIGASTRSGIMLVDALKAWALIQGRDFVSPDDFPKLTLRVLEHRLKLGQESSKASTALCDIVGNQMDKLSKTSWGRTT